MYYFSGPLGITFRGERPPDTPVLITSAGVEFDVRVESLSQITPLASVCESINGSNFATSTLLVARASHSVDGCPVAIGPSPGGLTIPSTILVALLDKHSSDELIPRDIIVVYGSCDNLESGLASERLFVTGMILPVCQHPMNF